ncbi:MAG: hypothetical protein AB7I19_06460 [Planctomycetota bacterium]
MARTRHKSNGCRRGAFKIKKMGKGRSSMLKPRGRPKPVVRTQEPEASPVAAE